jgi:Flp pilus assembly protein TadB
VDAMLAGAMLTNSGGPTGQLILLAIAGIGWTVGFVWIRRITRFREDSNRSFFRYRRRR